MRRALVLVALAALAAPAASLAAPRQVFAHNGAFEPRRVNVAVGDSVEWDNHDPLRSHNLHTDSGVFPDHSLGPQNSPTDSWSPLPTPFTSQMTVNYVCTIHPGMAGTVAVWNLWLADPPVATYGSNAKFTGYAQAGATSVQIEEADGTPIGSPAPVSGTGGYTALLGGLAPGTYRAHEGSNISRLVELKVKPKLTITKGKIRRGLWRLVVKAAPNQHNATAIVDKKKGFGWAKLASKSFGAQSKAIFTVQIPAGKSQLRVRVRLTNPRNGYSPATSASFVLKR